MRCDRKCTWEEADANMKYRIMDKYFDQDIKKDEHCELFCIEGIPAACMIYNQTNSHDAPIVDKFYLNKAMLLLFDAGPNMRFKLNKRYRHIDVRYAKNRNDFLLF